MPAGTPKFPPFLMFSALLVGAACLEQVALIGEWMTKNRLARAGEPPSLLGKIGRLWAIVGLMALVGAIREGCRMMRTKIPLLTEEKQDVRLSETAEDRTDVREV